MLDGMALTLNVTSGSVETGITSPSTDASVSAFRFRDGFPLHPPRASSSFFTGVTRWGVGVVTSGVVLSTGLEL